MIIKIIVKKNSDKTSTTSSDLEPKNETTYTHRTTAATEGLLLQPSSISG